MLRNIPEKIIYVSAVGFLGAVVVMTASGFNTTLLVLIIIFATVMQIFALYEMFVNIGRTHAWIMNVLVMFQKKGIAVELIDFENEHSFSVAHKQENGDLLCYIYPTGKVGLIKLAEDGTVSDLNGERHYVRKWLPLKKADRAAHILRNF